MGRTGDIMERKAQCPTCKRIMKSTYRYMWGDNKKLMKNDTLYFCEKCNKGVKVKELK